MVLENNSFAWEKGTASSMRPIFFSRKSWTTGYSLPEHKSQVISSWTKPHAGNCFQQWSCSPEHKQRSCVLMELETQCTLQSSKAGLTAKQPWLACLAQVLRWPLFPSSTKTTYNYFQSAIDLKVMKFSAKLLVEIEVCYWQEKLVQPVSLGWVDAQLYKQMVFLYQLCYQNCSMPTHEQVAINALQTQRTFHWPKWVAEQK